MQNPLLNDYIKKGNHGWAHAFQKVGFIMGEVIAFLILLMGMDSDKDTADLIFNLVAGGVLVVGLLVSVFMVKDKKVRRKYSKKVDGSWFLNKKKIEYDEDENDTSGEEEDLDGVGEGAMLLKAEKMA